MGGQYRVSASITKREGSQSFWWIEFLQLLHFVHQFGQFAPTHKWRGFLKLVTLSVYINQRVLEMQYLEGQLGPMGHSTESSSSFAPGGSNGFPYRLQVDRSCTVGCGRTRLLHHDRSLGRIWKSRRLVASFVDALICPVASNTPRARQFAITFDLLTMTRVTAQDFPLSFLRSLYIWRIGSDGKRVWGQIGYLKHVAAFSIVKILVVGRLSSPPPAIEGVRVFARVMGVLF